MSDIVMDVIKLVPVALVLALSAWGWVSLVVYVCRSLRPRK